MKKAQGLSLNMIIVAIIVLVVLVIMIFVFSGKMGAFKEETKSCSSRGGTCIASTTSCPGPTIDTDDCTKKAQVCCIKVLGGQS